jgi:mannosylglycoprotein endo-beta-mannosidase
MTQELMLKEVIEAITSLPKGKAPCHDGLLTKNFQENVEETAPTFLLAFRAMLSLGMTSDFINKRMITLIPKSEDHSKLGNWRPITLLGSIYKVLAKILAIRIQIHLPFVIRPNQTGFVMGRSIVDNNFLAQESLEWAVKSGQDLVLLLLDFEKTSK